MADPQQQALGQSDWDAAKPLTSSEWDSAKPLTKTDTKDKSAPSSWDLAMTAARQFASNFNPITMLHGLYQASEEHPAVAALASPLGAAAYAGAQQQYQKAKASYDQGHYSEAAGHTLAMLLPFVGPAAANAGEEIGTGDPETIAKGAGDAAAVLAAPKVMEAVSDALPAVQNALRTRASQAANVRSIANAARASADFKAAIPPTATTPYEAADLQRAAPFLAEEHATSPIASVDAVREGADSAITQIESHIQTYIDANKDRAITTDPIAVAKAKLAQGARADDVTLGLKELNGLGLSKTMTLPEAEQARLRLNAENQNQLAKNQYDVGNALKADPAFAARYYAAQALRDGIYDALDQQGIPDVRQLRQSEGSLIKIRDAAQAKRFAGEKPVAGTGANSIPAKIARAGIPAAGGAAGAYIGGPVGAAGGVVIGNEIAKAVAPSNLTRDALVERAMNTIGQTPRPTYPGVPPASPVRGQLTAPARAMGAVPVPSSGPNAVPPIVGGTSQPTVFSRQQLPAGTANGELTRTRLGPAPDKSHMQVLNAKSMVVRDPRTGRFKRVWTTEPKGGNQ